MIAITLPPAIGRPSNFEVKRAALEDLETRFRPSDRYLLLRSPRPCSVCLEVFAADESVLVLLRVEVFAKAAAHSTRFVTHEPGYESDPAVEASILHSNLKTASPQTKSLQAPRFHHPYPGIPAFHPRWL